MLSDTTLETFDDAGPARRRRVPGWLARAGSDRRVRSLLGWGLPLVVEMLHVALIAPHYFVGSFDDDSSYIITAKALLDGQGLTGHAVSGATVVGLYPPGYSALLVPLLWLWPHSFLPLRLFSTVCVAALFPLMWVYTGRKGVSAKVRSAGLLLLALTPVLATFATMVMAEAPYLLILLLMLLLVDRWDRQDRVWTLAGVGVLVASIALLWVKTAGVGAVLGLVLYLVVHRDARGRVRRAAVVAVGTALSLVPVLVARMVTHGSLLGSRYSDELGGYYHGGILSRVVHVAPSSTVHLLGVAIAKTVAPYGSPLPNVAALRGVVWQVFAIQIVVVMAIGMVAWWWRNRDAAAAVVLVYLFETVFWPEINERRVILVIPILVAWYALGAATLLRFVQRHGQAWRMRWPYPVTVACAVFVAVLTVVMLIPQVPRDYLFALGQDTSHFGGSRYASLLSRLGQHDDVVESDYLSTTALFTGHLTGWAAFAAAGYLPCNFAGITSDNASYMLLGDVNHAGVLDSPCLKQLASTSDWAVELLHSARDNATVYELIGPGTGNPDLVDLTRSAGTPSRDGDRTVFEWSWVTPEALDQFSVGSAGVSGAATTSVRLEVRSPAGTWSTVASSRSALGGAKGDAPYLLATDLGGEKATAVRVVVTASSPAGIATVENVAALGG